MEPITVIHSGYTITTDKSLMKVRDIHKWLSEESYWCKDISFEKVKASFDHSFCVGAMTGDEQIGFGRLITDYNTFGYLADVYVQQAHRGKGIAKAMMQLLLGLDWVQGLRGVMLATRDMHSLYKQFGFAGLPNPERYMKIDR